MPHPFLLRIIGWTINPLKGVCRCATTILAIKTLATEKTAFATGKSSGSNRGVVPAHQYLTTTDVTGEHARETETALAAQWIHARSSRVILISREDMSASWFGIAFTTIA